MRTPPRILTTGLTLFLATLGVTAETAAPGPVWPPPPDEARVAYISSIGKPAEAGAKVGGFKRIANFITGAKKGNEPLVKPFAIALDEKDNLCVTDTGVPAVCFFDRKARRWKQWREVDRIRFVSPVGIASGSGVFYVADSALAAVISFDQKGRVRFVSTNKLERPVGVALTDRRLLVADSQRHRIVSLDASTGRFLSEIGERGGGPGQFNYPTHVSVARSGDILVTDSMNHRVQVLSPEGTFLWQAGGAGDSAGSFSRPKGAATDSDGHLYVVDAIFDNVQLFDEKGRLLLIVGEAGSRSGQFWMPNGIAISRGNEIFVTDTYNRRIQTLKYLAAR